MLDACLLTISSLDSPKSATCVLNPRLQLCLIPLAQNGVDIFIMINSEWSKSSVWPPQNVPFHYYQPKKPIPSTSLWSEKKETYSGTHWLIQQNIGWFNIPVYNWRNCLKKEITKNKEVSESVIYCSRRFPLGQTWFRNWVPAKMYFVGERYFMLISRILGTEDRVVFN